MSDQDGYEAGRYRYDPWGKPFGTPLQGSAVGTGNRGFTGHEHLVGDLIHMNGRIYDPVLGRFLSADIVVSMPHNVQSYNRYSYVFNNPLAYTDPSGYIPLFVFPLIFAAFAYAIGEPQLGRMFLSMSAAFLLGPNGPISNFFGMGNLTATIAAGFASGGISTGTLRGAFQGAGTALLFYGAGTIAGNLAAAEGTAAAIASGDVMNGTEIAGGVAEANSIWAHGGIGRAGLHAIAGCVGALAGGKCGSGALSAGFAEFAGPKLDAIGAPGIVSRVIVGGIASELGGGKFANGAMTAAFGYLFNELVHLTTATQRGYGVIDRIEVVYDPARAGQQYDSTINVYDTDGALIGSFVGAMNPQKPFWLGQCGGSKGECSFVAAGTYAATVSETRLNGAEAYGGKFLIFNGNGNVPGMGIVTSTLRTMTGVYMHPGGTEFNGSAGCITCQPGASNWDLLRSYLPRTGSTIKVTLDRSSP
jgi:RHS repeat-associated protein